MKAKLFSGVLPVRKNTWHVSMFCLACAVCRTRQRCSNRAATLLLQMIPAGIKHHMVSGHVKVELCQRGDRGVCTGGTSTLGGCLCLCYQQTQATTRAAATSSINSSQLGHTTSLHPMHAAAGATCVILTQTSLCLCVRKAVAMLL